MRPDREVQQCFMQLALGNLGFAPADPDRLPDTADGLIIVAIEELLPRRDDAGRVAADGSHVQHSDPLGVIAEFLAELAEPRFGEDDHNRLLAGQAIPDKAHRAGKERVHAAVEQGFVLIAGMGPDQDGALSHSHRPRRVRSSRNPNTPWWISFYEHVECSYC